MTGELPVGQNTILTAKDLATVDDFQKRVQETLKPLVMFHITGCDVMRWGVCQMYNIQHKQHLIEVCTVSICWQALQVYASVWHFYVTVPDSSVVLYTLI